MNKLLHIYHQWLIKRRKSRIQKINTLIVKYSIFPGPDIAFASPWMVERQIKQAMKSSKNFNFNDNKRILGDESIGKNIH